jgi:hypothetical protein
MVEAVGDVLQHTFELLEAVVNVLLKLINATLLLGKC